MPNALSGALSKARAFGGPLAGFQNPQGMQMPRPQTPGGIMPPGGGAGLPGMGGGIASAPVPVPGPDSASPAPQNTGIVPPHMRQPGPMGAPAGPMMGGQMGGQMGQMGGKRSEMLAQLRNHPMVLAMQKRRAARGVGGLPGTSMPVPGGLHPSTPSSPFGPPAVA